jgi:hypothetical protein
MASVATTWAGSAGNGPRSDPGNCTAPPLGLLLANRLCARFLHHFKVGKVSRLGKPCRRVASHRRQAARSRDEAL